MVDKLIEKALEGGAKKASAVPVGSIVLHEVFLDYCKMNTCGQYGKCWTCPPDIGDIHDLMAELKTYKTAVVYQTVGLLEDSFDIEGMQRQRVVHNRLARQLRKLAPDALHLAAGGCRVCERCAKVDEEPCRFPKEALASLEAYGINVSELAPLAGMKYINGKDTVTYFGAIFLK